MRGRKRRGTSHQQCIGYLQCFDRHKFMRTAIGFLSNQLFPCTNFLFVAKSLTPDTTLYHMWELHFRIQFTSFGRREKSKSPSNNCAHRYNLSRVSLFSLNFLWNFRCCFSDFQQLCWQHTVQLSICLHFFRSAMQKTWSFKCFRRSPSMWSVTNILVFPSIQRNYSKWIKIKSEWNLCIYCFM